MGPAKRTEYKHCGQGTSRRPLPSHLKEECEFSRLLALPWEWGRRSTTTTCEKEWHPLRRGLGAVLRGEGPSGLCHPSQTQTCGCFTLEILGSRSRVSWHKNSSLLVSPPRWSAPLAVLLRGASCCLGELTGYFQGISCIHQGVGLLVVKR